MAGPARDFRVRAGLRGQAIDRAVLADLSDQDLKDLGIPLGHRKRLFKAIAALEGPSPAQPESPSRPERNAAS